MTNPELSRQNFEVASELLSQRIGALHESLCQLAEANPSSAEGLMEQYEKMLNGQHDYTKFRDLLARYQDYMRDAASKIVHGPDAPHLIEDLVQDANEYLLRWSQKYKDSLKDLIDPSKTPIIKNLLWITVQNKAKDMFKAIRRNPLYNRNEIYEEGINRSAITGETTSEKLPLYVDLAQEEKTLNAIDRKSAASRMTAPEAEIILDLENPNLIQGLMALPDVDREILMLRLADLSNEDIAEKLGITVEAAAKRIERAKKKLKEKLSTL